MTTKMMKTFWIIVDETKTKTKMKTRDENDIKINSILVLTTLTRISKATFGTWRCHSFSEPHTVCSYLMIDLSHCLQLLFYGTQLMQANCSALRTGRILLKQLKLWLRIWTRASLQNLCPQMFARRWKSAKHFTSVSINSCDVWNKTTTKI